MGKNSSKVKGEVLIMKTISIGQERNKPIEWKQYEGEDVCVNTTIRQGKRIQRHKIFRGQGQSSASRQCLLYR